MAFDRWHPQHRISWRLSWRALRSLAPAAALLVAATSQAQIVNGDFESGNTGFSSDYTFGDVSAPGTYTIGSDPSSVAGSYPDWESFGDHTSGSGLMLIANGATNASAAVWSETVSVTPNSRYRLTFWGATVNTSSPTPANIVVQINGVPVGGSNIFPNASPVTGGAWVPFSVDWNSGASTLAAIELFDATTSEAYNDFALDDISLTTGAFRAPVLSGWWMAALAMSLIVGGRWVLLRRAAAR